MFLAKLSKPSSRARESLVSFEVARILGMAGAALLGAHVPNALAQTAPPQPGPVADAGDLQEVVVTGSRIARRDYDSMSPIVTINADAFENNSSVAIESTLNQLPQFSTAGNQSSLSSAAKNPFPSATATPGAATLDMRYLGVNRTLILVDGQRAQPVNASLAVDVNSIPAAAIESVETITGGAASTYGADAIAGVVNFKLKKNFQGFQIDAQTGASQVGDDQEHQISALMGSNFDNNRGNMMLALSWSKRGDVNGANHAWVKAGWNDPGTFAGSVPLPSYSPAPGNLPTSGWLGAGQNYTVDQNGNLFNVNNPLDPAHPYTGPMGGSSGYRLNPDGSLGWNNEQSDPLQIPMTKWSAFAAGHYNINDHVSAYVKLNFSQTITDYHSSGYSELGSVWEPSVPYNQASDDPASATFGQVSTGGTFHPVPAQLAALLNSTPTATTNWNYVGPMTYISGFEELNTSTIYQMTLGFNGDLPWSWSNDWTWEVYGSHGQTNVDQQQPNGYPAMSRVQSLFNSNLYGQGYQNTYGIAVSGSCTSGLPIFTASGGYNSSTSISADCQNWLLMRLNTVTQLTQQVAEADLQGPMFDMPFNAGKVRAAFGADYRGENFSFNPDSGVNANQLTPEVVQDIIMPVTVQGATGVKEVYAEAAIPLAKDLPFVKSLEVDPGYRYSDYNDQGGVNTFKVLGNWAVTDWVKFRGGLEVANRAPNIAELFTPAGSSQLSFNAPDPCATYSYIPTWGNVASNPNRKNVQALCEYLMVRGGTPQSVADALMAPGSAAANSYNYTFGGPSPSGFPYALALTEGNPKLKSEVARTLTWGVVLHSPLENPLTSKMSLSVDWYHIQLDGAIGEPQFLTVYQQCLDPQFNSMVGAAYGTYTGAQMAANNPYCANINREYNPAAHDLYGAVRNYNAQYMNTGGIKTSGIDAEFDWTVRPSDIGSVLARIPGAFNLNLTGSYLQEYAESPYSGAAYTSYQGTTYSNTATGVDSYFRYKLYTTLSYNVGPVGAGLRWQHLPGLAAPPGSSPGTLGAGAANYYSLFAHWAVNDVIELRGGVDNLFDAWPRWVGAIPGYNNEVGNTNENYDTIGRRFYLGVKAKF